MVEELKEKEEKINELNSQLDKTKKPLRSEELTELKDERERKNTNNIMKGNKRIRFSENELDEIELSESELQIKSLKEKIRFLESQLNKKRREEKTTENEIKRLENQLISKSDSLKEKEEKTAKRIAELSQENNRKEKTIKNLENSEKSLSKIVEEKEESIKRLLTEINKLKKEKQEEKDIFDILLNEKKEEKEKEKNEAREKKNQLEKDFRIKELELENYKNLLEESNNKLEVAQFDIVNLEEQINLFRQDIDQEKKEEEKNFQSSKNSSNRPSSVISRTSSGNFKFPLSLGKVAGERLSKSILDSNFYNSPLSSPTLVIKNKDNYFFPEKNSHKRSSSELSINSLSSNSSSIYSINSLEEALVFVKNLRDKLSKWKEIGKLLDLEKHLDNDKPLKEALGKRNLTDLLEEINSLENELKSVKEKKNFNSTKKEISSFMTPESTFSEQSTPKEINQKEQIERNTFDSITQTQWKNQQIPNNKTGLGIINQDLIESTLSEKRIIERIISDSGLPLKKNTSVEQLVDFIKGLINPPFKSNSQNQESDNYEKIQKENQGLKEKLKLIEKKLSGEIKRVIVWKKRSDETKKEMNGEISEKSIKIQNLTNENIKFRNLWNESRKEIDRIKTDQELKNRVEILVN